LLNKKIELIGNNSSVMIFLHSNLQNKESIEFTKIKEKWSCKNWNQLSK